MKKRIISVLCVAVLAAVIAIPSIGVETAEASESSTDTTESEESGIILNGPYRCYDLNGLWTLGYEITNNKESCIYSGLTTCYLNDSNECIGIDSEYSPCIAPGEKAYIYTTNYFDATLQVNSIECENTSAVSAIDDLSDLLIEEGNDSLSMTIQNNSSERVEVSVTVVYTLNSEPVGVDKKLFVEKGNEGLYLDPGSKGTADFDFPDQEFDDYIYYLTAEYYQNDLDSNDTALLSSEKNETQAEETTENVEKVSLTFKGMRLTLPADGEFEVNDTEAQISFNGMSDSIGLVKADTSYALAGSSEDQKYLNEVIYDEIYGYGFTSEDTEQKEISIDGHYALRQTGTAIQNSDSDSRAYDLIVISVPEEKCVYEILRLYVPEKNHISSSEYEEFIDSITIGS